MARRVHLKRGWYWDGMLWAAFMLICRYFAGYSQEAPVEVPIWILGGLLFGMLTNLRVGNSSATDGCKG